MKKVKFYLPVLLITMLLAQGCKKFLDEPYDSRIKPETVEQYAKMLTDAYPLRHELFTDILTDDYQYYATLAQAVNTDRYLPMYLFSDNYPQNIPTGPENAYAEFYAKIYRANIVIDGVPKSTGGSEEQKAAILGEALMIRAYCHFMLVNLFAQHYNAATAGTDLGVSIVTAISQEKQQLTNRSTVQEVYDQVERDATAALGYLATGAQFVPKNPYHFSLASANAFMTRLKLYKGEWDEVIRYADEVIRLKGRTVRNLAADLALIGNFSIPYYATMYMDPPTHPNILLSSYSATNSVVSPTGFLICGFFPSDEIRSTYASNDLRRQIFQQTGTVIDMQVVATKYNTQPNNPNSFVRTAHFTTDEVLFNRAEAVLRSSTGTIESALQDINTIRAARYTNYTNIRPADMTRDQLLQLVLAERRKDQINEGMRWFDVKRLRLRVEHALARDLPPAAVLEQDDLKKALQIPLAEQLGNPGIQLNPR